MALACSDTASPFRSVDVTPGTYGRGSAVASRFLIGVRTMDSTPQRSTERGGVHRLPPRSRAPMPSGGRGRLSIHVLPCRPLSPTRSLWAPTAGYTGSRQCFPRRDVRLPRVPIGRSGSVARTGPPGRDISWPRNQLALLRTLYRVVRVAGGT